MLATFQLIVMKDGRLQACGSYKDIELKQPQIIAKWNSIIAKANENAKDQQQKWVHVEAGAIPKRNFVFFFRRRGID